MIQGDPGVIEILKSNRLGPDQREGVGGGGRSVAEVHGNRTHLPGCSPGTPDLKSGRATSALSTSNSNSITKNTIYYIITIDLKNNLLL
jgi:hypothetical protein